LIEHIRTSWRKGGIFPRHFITVVPPQMRREETKVWYRGTADSIYQNINLIYDFKPRFVAIFGGDHVYRMDIKGMIDFHIRKKSKLTIASMPIEGSQANQFGVAEIDGDSRINIRGFNQRNVAVMLDGIPVNDMETVGFIGQNWFGLDVVMRKTQIQRGF